MIKAGDEYYVCLRCGTEYEDRKPTPCPICKRRTRFLTMFATKDHTGEEE